MTTCPRESSWSSWRPWRFDLSPQAEINLGQFVRQRIDVVEHEIVPLAEYLRQILVRHRVHRDAKRVDAARDRLLHRHARVLVQIAAIAAVVIIFGPAV